VNFLVMEASASSADATKQVFADFTVGERDTCMSLLEVAIRNREFDQALVFLNLARHRNWNAQAMSALVLRSAARAGYAEIVHSVLCSEYVLSQNDSVLRTAIGVYCKQQRWDLLYEVVVSADICDTVPSFLFDAAIRLACATGRQREAFEILGRATRSGVCLDLEVYHCALQSCGSLAMATLGGMIIKEMLASPLVLDNRTVVLTTRLYGAAGDPAAAIHYARLFSERFDFCLGVEAYTALVDACVENDAGDEALELFEASLQGGVQPHILEAVVVGCFRLGYLEDAVGVIHCALDVDQGCGIPSTLLKDLVFLLYRRGLGVEVATPLLDRVVGMQVAVLEPVC